MIVNALTLSFVEFIPERLDEGVLYVSRRYRTASHLCCCGCGREVVTPLNPAKWKLNEYPDGSGTLSPSVGNWGFPCKSHYLVIRNRVHWAQSFSAAQIAAVQAQDRQAVEQFRGAAKPNFIETLQGAWTALVEAIKKWMRGS
jgi:hypothetical protein